MISICRCLAVFVAIALSPQFSAAQPKAKAGAESKWKLPVTSEARWFEKKKSDLDRFRKVMPLAYDKVGKHDPRWDEVARSTLEAAARVFSNQIKPITARQDIYPAAKRAIEAGCDDPYVLFAWGWSCDGIEADPVEVERRSIAAAEAMSTSKYAPLGRSIAMGNAAQLIVYGRRFAAQRDKAVRFAEGALDNLVLGLKEDRSAFPSDEYRQQAEVLRGLYAVLLEDPQKGFDYVDKALAKAPAGKDVRLKARAGFLVQQAWAGRGFSYANTLTEERSRQYEERVKSALKALDETWDADPTDPWTATTAMRALKGLDGEVGEHDRDVKRWFDRAMKADPDNRRACEELLDYLDPRWHGSKDEMLAFARQCAKTANVYNRLGLLIVEAHMRVVMPEEQDVRRRYLSQQALLTEVSGAIDRYFLKVADDKSERGRIAMFTAIGGDPVETMKWFDRAGSTLTPTHIYSLKDMMEARLAMQQTCLRINPRLLPPRTWDQLASPWTNSPKSADRLACEWMIDQGGKVRFQGPKDKTPRVATKLDALPREAFKVIGLEARQRSRPNELPPIADLPNLEALTLSWIDLQPSELKRMRNLPALRTLELSNSPTIDDAALAEVVRVGPDLTTLSLERTAVTDEGLRRLESLPRLTTLKLTGCFVSDRSIDVLCKLKNLVDVDLDRTEVSDEGFGKLLTALPRCRLKTEYGVMTKNAANAGATMP